MGFDLLFEAYCAASYDPESFWDLTPREFDHRMSAVKSRLELEARNQRWLVYVGAALQRAKKLPPYSKFNPKPRPSEGPRGEAEMLAAFDARIQSEETKKK